MHIHFVCTGNLYRGRLAEAYLKAKAIPGLTVTSSGTAADKHAQYIGPISWEALRLIKHNNLVPFMKPTPELTSARALAGADQVIFFGHDNYAAARECYGYDGDAYQIWEIPDIAVADDISRIEASEKAFAQITSRVDELVEKLRARIALLG